MAKKTAREASPKVKPNAYTVTIEPISPVAFAVPGIRKAAPGDTITFHNKTGGPVRLSVAADGVFKGLKKLQPKLISTGKKRTFERCHVLH